MTEFYDDCARLLHAGRDGIERNTGALLKRSPHLEMAPLEIAHQLSGLKLHRPLFRRRKVFATEPLFFYTHLRLLSPHTTSNGRKLYGIAGGDMDSANKQAIINRCAITAVLFFVGFAFPLFWIAAAFFAYTAYNAFPDPEPDTPENMYRPRQSTVTTDDPNWRKYFLAACESPAETAFLDAMINDFGLIPDNGLLVAPGIELDMQTEYKPYRLDFLVNKWLIVEVDGAAWHSSPEAIDRDRIRDEFFVAKGFHVLRISAKIVFNTPTKSVEMVRAAIARGKPQQKIVAKSAPISVAKTFTNSVNSFAKFMDDVDASLKKRERCRKL